MSWCEFKIGQKVVCLLPISTRSDKHETSPSLKVGEIYTIRSVSLADFTLNDGSVGREIPAIRLVGYVRTFDHGEFHDYPVIAARFRPLAENEEEKEYDISIFRQMCVDAGKPKRKAKAVSGKND